MKYSLFILSFLSLGLHFSFGETRLGNYYFGFEVSRIDHSRSYLESNGTSTELKNREMDGVSLNLALNLPLSDSFDLKLAVNRSDFSDDNKSDHLNKASADLIFRYNRIKRDTGFILPFAGLGLLYTEYHNHKEKFHAVLQTGAEIYLHESFTLTPRFNYIHSLLKQEWNHPEISENDFKFDLSLTWLATRKHALSLGFSKHVDSEVSTFGIEYLHSWK